MMYELQFLCSLGITLLVEVPLAIVIVKCFKEPKISLLRTVGIGILATSLTIPYLWFIFAAFFDYWTMAVWGEVFVCIVEAVLYWKLLPLPLPKALLLSLLANGASIAV
ncbi:MAG: hypothetical protein LBP53_01950 [Candidatus Peribacteria bacterium]|jgi:hypothetical protein|nr:hypothetical protein [Candidatus Peribacteria bacterium]